MENYDILSNGFCILLLLPFPSLHTSNRAAFLFFSLCYLFRLKAHTHCSVASSSCRSFVASTDSKILMDFSDFQKTNARKERKNLFRGSLSSFMIVVEHNHRISQGWRCLFRESLLRAALPSPLLSVLSTS